MHDLTPWAKPCQRGRDRANDGSCVFEWLAILTGEPGVGKTAVESPLIQLDSPLVALVAGWQHTCALRADQRETCWGRGGQGQLGYGDSENVGDDDAPDAKGTVEIGRPVTTMWAGGISTYLGNVEGDVRCFGEGLSLGNSSTGNIGDDELPADRPPLSFGFPIRQLAIGTEHMCALGLSVANMEAVLSSSRSAPPTEPSEASRLAGLRGTQP